jgi:hypothetical protein
VSAPQRFAYLRHLQAYFLCVCVCVSPSSMIMILSCLLVYCTAATFDCQAVRDIYKCASMQWHVHGMQVSTHGGLPQARHWPFQSSSPTLNPTTGHGKRSNRTARQAYSTSYGQDRNPLASCRRWKSVSQARQGKAGIQIPVLYCTVPDKQALHSL